MHSYTIYPQCVIYLIYIVVITADEENSEFNYFFTSLLNQRNSPMVFWMPSSPSFNYSITLKGNCLFDSTSQSLTGSWVCVSVSEINHCITSKPLTSSYKTHTFVYGKPKCYLYPYCIWHREGKCMSGILTLILCQHLFSLVLLLVGGCSEPHLNEKKLLSTHMKECIQKKVLIDVFVCVCVCVKF